MHFILYLSLIVVNGIISTFGNNEYLDPNNRIAPPDQPRFTSSDYIITEDHLKYIRSELFYWFFDQDSSDTLGGDYLKYITESNPQIIKDLNFPFPFFGFQFNYTTVSLNSFLGFSNAPQHYAIPLQLSIEDRQKQNERSFIGILLTKCRIGQINAKDKDQRTPGVYFRLEKDLQFHTDPLGVDLRERLKWDIREGIIGAEQFVPKHVIITTWKDISFNGGTGSSLNISNSFQIVLVTDEIYTYAIFNYKRINWQPSTISNEDTKLNAFGNGTGFYEYYQISQTSFLENLTHEGMVNSSRYIFRIDEEIIPGICHNDGWHDFSPKSGNMLGGTVVNITGPCFNKKQKIICHFDKKSVLATVVNRNRAFCIQPFLSTPGYIPLTLSVNGKYSKGRSKYFVELPSSINEEIYLKDNSIYQNVTNQILMQWNPKKITENISPRVSISIWGYSESLNKPRFEYIDVIENSVKNNGSYRILPGNYILRDNKAHLDMEFGFLQINSTTFDEYCGFNITRVLWSRPIPLGWYFGSQWERIYGKHWSKNLCDRWLHEDQSFRDFINDLQLCPCKLDEAINDKGSFLPDPECDKDSNSSCLFNEEAVHCVRSGQQSKQDSEQQCCYDRNGSLLLQYDKMFNNYPKRVHILGTTPWNEADKVPTLSQWFQDIRPFFACCFWQDEQSNGYQNLHFERRPLQDCVGYQPPSVAAVFGDPHFVTFDNLQYTFNGMGDFVLAKGNNGWEEFDVQGRFEKLENNIHGEIHATHLTSIATRGNTTTVIEIKLRPPQAQWRYRLDVMVDGERIFFDRPGFKFQYFNGVTAYTPTYILNQSEVIIMYSSRVGVQIVENEGFLTARVYIPTSFINKTNGLFGKWSFDPQDDFTLPDGRIAVLNLNNFEHIHKEFGMKWKLSEKINPGVGISLFTRKFSSSANQLLDYNFIPNFIREPQDFLPSNSSIDITEANDICFNSYQCRYDYGMTLNKNMAHFTRRFLDNILDIKWLTERIPNSCGSLETPKYGRKLNFNYRPGDQILFTCNKGFILFGDNIRTCMNDGKWNVPVYGVTQCLRHVSFIQQFQLKEAIFTSIVLIIILCFIGYFLYKYKFCHRSVTKCFGNKKNSLSSENLYEIISYSDEEEEML